MMTTPMENGDSDLSSAERAKCLYNKNVGLEKRSRKAAQARVPSDPNTWQQMRENYEAIILEDHTFSEQHEIEYALWQLHYKRIEELRALFSAALASSRSAASQNGKGPARPGQDRVTKILAHFKTFLSEATGFYHDLILKVKAKYGIPLGHFSDDADNQIGLFKDGNNSSEIKKGLISCHRCFIYLGDLARYKGLYGEGDSKARHFAAASSYYMQASSLWPSSGNPHHQLAILAAYSGDELVVIYRYFRSLAVNIPFATARDNLIIAFEKNRQGYSQLHGNLKASTLEPAAVVKGREESETKEQQCSVPNIFKAFSARFVRLNGILFTCISLETFDDVFSLVKSDLLELLSSGPEEEFNFGSDTAECSLVIIRLVAMLIFTIYNLNKETKNKSYAEILQQSVLLQNAFTAIFEFMGHIVQRCVQLADSSTSYLLPGIMVFLEWLACHQDIAAEGQVEDKQANARSFFWSNCISFLNKLLSSGFTCIDGDDTCFFDMTSYNEGETANRLALSEDIELRGFLPILSAHLILDFSRKHFGTDSGNKETRARIQRIIAAGKSLANVVRVGEQGIHFDIKLKRFVIGVEPQISEDISQISPWDDPKFDDSGQDHLIDRETFAKSLQPKAQFYVEGDEEDEVIVFKPTVTEKLIDGIDAKWNISEVPVLGVNALKNGFGDAASFSASQNGSLSWNTFDMDSMPSASVVSLSAPYLQAIQPNTSNWLVEQGSIVNGLANLNLLDNDYTFKPKLPDHAGIFHSAAISAPHLHSTIVGTGNKCPVGVQDSPKYDSVMSSRVGSDDLAKKLSSLTSTSLKKNPVSRPVRHLGPPPGFSTFPPKIVENSLPAANLSDGNLVMDDYRWLDGYQMPSSTESVQYDNSMVQAEAYHPMSSINSSLGMVSFPFPGKQASVLRLENQKGLQDYQVHEHLKVHQDQQLHLHRGNQQVLAQQYHGQSIWEGRFLA